MGHRAGAGAVREIVDECGRLGVRVVTMYSFSLENWKRPKEEIEALMQLCMTYLEGERDHMKRENIRFKVIGRRRGEAPLPEPVIAAIEDVERATAHCTGPTLCLAINYGARAELVDAVRSIAARAAAGDLSPAAIDEGAIAKSLYTGDLGELAEPDLLIRTAGEMRISNFLLWQISYSELYVTDTFWPDFGRAQLHEAIRAYAGRRRRFGGLDSAT
jgi:undecaprenyl diphosphate synthase